MMGEPEKKTAGKGVRNADLYDKFRTYCQAAVAMLNSRLDEPGNGLDYAIVVPRFILQEDGSVQPSEKQEADLLRTLRRHRAAVKEMEESQSVVQALKEDKAIARYLGKAVWFPGWGANSPGAETWAQVFLEKALYEGGGQYEDAVFDNLYRRMEAFFYEDQLELKVLAPLGGFEKEGDPIEIGPKLRIVRLTQADVDTMAQVFPFSPFGLYRKPWPARRRWGLELYLSMEKQVDAGGSEARAESLEDMWQSIASERLDEVCSAMRVYKKGDLWYDLMLGVLTSWLPSDRPLIGGLWNLSRLAWEEYALSAEEATGFVEFWSHWGKGEHWKNLDVAVRRFSLGCDRSSPVDRLIDYVIALEALLLPDEKIGEYRYRLAIRGAALLGKDPDDRAAVRRNLAEAYDRRSSIVHGTEEKPETVSWRKQPEEGEKRATENVAFREFVEYISDYVRALIKKLAQRVEEKDLVSIMVDDIDDAIAKGFATRDQQ